MQVWLPATSRDLRQEDARANDVTSTIFVAARDTDVGAVSPGLSVIVSELLAFQLPPPNGSKSSKFESNRGFGSRKAHSRVWPSISRRCHPVSSSKYLTAVATDR